MQTTRLGHTGVTVSRICLGCMSYGDPKWRPWVLDADAARPFFKTAIEAGINFFDTADMYSLGVSEEITSRWLREFGNLEEIVLATKVFNRMGEGPNRQGLSRKHILQGCEASLKRLGIEAIDLYQIHRFDPKTPIEETLAALDQLVRQGKVRYLGASSMYAWQFMKMLSASELGGWAKLVTMQNHYNLIYREEEREMIPLCESERIGILPWSPLARGLLAGARQSIEDRQSTVRAESDEYAARLYDHASDWIVVEAVRLVAEERGDSMAQIALAWLLSKPSVVAPIIGATKLSHLESAIAAVDIQLTAAEIEALEAPYQPHEVKGM